MLISGSKPVNPSVVGDDVYVGTPNRAYYEMQLKWKLVEALRGGTEEMRKIKEFLPQEPKESDDAYKIRVRRTFLYNLYWRTITAITGLAFIKPVVVNNVPTELEYLQFNFDGTGRSLTEVAYDMTIDAIHYGKTHLLADFPITTNNVVNLREFKNSNYRPYMSHINPTRLIGWQLKSGSGIPQLENIRILEHTTEPSSINPWGEVDVYYVRVIYEDRIDVYKFDPEVQTNYEFQNTTPNSLGYIPVTTSYSNKTGFMTAEPALYDLAQLNLRHWQSSSDQNNILHIARVPFLHAAGFEDGELTNTEIGVNRMIVSSKPDSTIKYVEHTGSSIEAGRKDLKDLEMQMATLGADLLMSKNVSRQTATARRLDQNESMSTLQMALRSVEQSVETAYQSAGAWIGIDASEVSVSIGDDLSVANEPNPTNALIALLDSGLLTDEQTVEEAKRQGILSSYFKLSNDRPRAQEPEEDPFNSESEDDIEDDISQEDEEMEQNNNE